MIFWTTGCSKMAAMVKSCQTTQPTIWSMSEVASVSDSTFKEEVLESDIPVLVDFGATWCGPSRSLAPLVDEIAAQYKGKIKVVKVIIDENPSVASQYGIRSIPAILIFNGGQRVETLVGSVPKTKLVETFKKYL